MCLKQALRPQSLGSSGRAQSTTRPPNHNRSRAQRSTARPLDHSCSASRTFSTNWNRVLRFSGEGAVTNTLA